MAKNLSTVVLDRITDTLVLEAKFPDKETALRSLARSAVRERMVRYRRRIQRMERKHGMNFVGFTSLIEGNATPQQEDDWFSWKSAIDMMDEWKSVYESLEV